MIRKTAGFTLIEIVVSIAIVMVLSGLSLAAYINFNNRQLLNSAADELKNNFRQIRGWAMTGKKPADCTDDLMGYRLDFDSSNREYRTFALCPESSPILVNTFSYGEKYDEKITIAVSENSVIFQALTGAVNNNGEAITLTISLVNSPGLTRVLEINSSGEISYGIN